MNTAGLSNLIFIALIVGVFYFLVIRPQQKRSAAQRQMLAALKPGDKIVTIGGIYAEIVDIGERVRVRVADGTEFELAKQAIGQVLPVEQDPAIPTEDDLTTGDQEQPIVSSTE